MKIILIAAMSTNRVIGFHKKIPWHFPEETAHFKQTTMGHAVIMGRKTYESIGFVLPGRRNIIISRNKNLTIEGAEVLDDLEKAIHTCRNQKKIFIIGGNSLYALAMFYCDEILLSVIHQEFKGDTFFPAIPQEEFDLVSEKVMGENPLLTIQTFKRKRTSR